MNAKKLVLLSLCLAPALVGCATMPAVQPVTEEQMMARWMEFMSPGPGHQALASKVGNWNMTVRMFMAPGGPASESTGKSSVQWILDGRYLEDKTTGDFNGQTFQGQGLTGYDNLKKKYVSTWIDNMGTGVLYGEGDYDSATRTFSYVSEGPDLMFRNAYVPTRNTEHWIDSDHWVMQSFAPDGEGKEYLAMEIAYTRAK